MNRPAFALLVFPLLTPNHASAFEFDLPQRKEPLEIEAMERFKKDWPVVGLPSFLQPPAERPKLDCPVPDEIANYGIHVPSEKSVADIDKTVRKSIREMGNDLNLKTRLLKSRIVVMSVECVGRKPSGRIDRLVESETESVNLTEFSLSLPSGTRTIRMATTSRRQEMTRSEGVVLPDGSIQPVRTVTRSTLEMTSRSDDAEYEQIMSSVKKPALPPSTSVTVTYPGQGPSFTVSEFPETKSGVFGGIDVAMRKQLQTTFQKTGAVGDKVLVESESYQGARRISQMSSTMKNQLMHGWMLTRTPLPPNMKTENMTWLNLPVAITVDGEPWVESRVCYELGRVIKTEKCADD